MYHFPCSVIYIVANIKLIWFCKPTFHNNLPHTLSLCLSLSHSRLHTHTHTHTCTRADMNARAHTHTHTHVYTCRHECACTHTHTHTRVHVHTWMRAHTHTCTHSYTYTHFCITFTPGYMKEFVSLEWIKSLAITKVQLIPPVSFHIPQSNTELISIIIQPTACPAAML